VFYVPANTVSVISETVFTGQKNKELGKRKSHLDCDSLQIVYKFSVNINLASTMSSILATYVNRERKTRVLGSLK